MSPKPLSIDGDAYISTKEAASLTGYTSDYIGQLARAGKFGSVMYGKARFVHKVELLTHIRAHGSKKQKESLADLLKTLPTETETVTSVDTKTDAVEETQKVEVAEHTEESERVEAAEAVEDVVPRALTPLIPREPVRDVVWEQPVPTEAAPALASSFFSKFSTYVVLLLLIASLGMFSLPLYRDAHIDIALIDRIQDNALANTLASTIGSRVVGWYCSALGVLEPLGVRGCRYETRVTPSETDTPLPASRGGLVVVPGTGDREQDAATINQIRGAFSDEVLVTPDVDGLSGSIKPVFKDRVGDPYLYVIVPVEGE